MKPINFVGPVQVNSPFEFAKRVYAYEADMKGNSQLERDNLRKITLPATRKITVANFRTNIAGVYT